MNQYLTYCARAKLLELAEKTEAYGVRITVTPYSAISIQPVFSIPMRDDIMINVIPHVFTSLSSLKQMKDRAIDFDYDTQELIFSRDPNVIHSHT